MNWKKLVRWTAMVIGVIIFVIVGGGFVVLKTSWFHHYVLAHIMEEGQTATGGKLDVQDWDVHVSPLRADLYGVVLHGTESVNAKPLLQIQELTVGINASSLLHRKLQLTELLIKNPIANVQVANNGTNNLPTPPPAKTSSNTNVWTLAVGHTLLSHGEVYYNDKKSQLDADLYQLRTEIYFDPSATRYSGTLSYRDGKLQYANYAPLPHNLDANFNATPSGATLNSLLLTIGSSRISLHGEMSNYSSPQVNASYQLLIHTQDFAAMSPDVRPAGDIRIDGDLRYHQVANQPMLRTAAVNGTIKSDELQAASTDVSLGLRGLKAQYRLANGDLDVSALAADLVNGHLDAQLAIRHVDATPIGNVHASLQHISLESTKKCIKQSDIRQMPVTGTVDAKVDASWAGNVKNVRALADLALRAAVWNNSVTPKSAVPVDGTVHLAYDGPHNVIALHQTILRMPSTTVTMDGELSSRSNLSVHAIAGDLNQLSLLASALSAKQASGTYAISGSATLNAVVHGPMLKPQISGALDGQNLRVQGSEWRSAHLQFAASPSQVSVQQGSLVSAQQGNLTFSAQAGLKNWSYVASDPIAANLSARRMSLAELEHLANRQDPIAGNLSADIAFHGSELHPAGHGSIQLSKATAYDQPIQNFIVQFQGANDTIDSQINLALPAGSATANVSYTPKTKAYKVQLSAPGIVLQKLQAVQAKNLPLSGTLNASAKGAGTIDDPQLSVVVQIPSLQVRETQITGMKAQVDVKNKRADLLMSSNVTQASVQAKATVDLTGNYNTQASIETTKVPLDPFLAVYAPSVPPGFHGETELHATLKGPLKDKSRLEAHLTIPTLDGSYQSVQFSNAGPIHADYVNDVLTLAPAEIRGTETSLRFQGRIPVQGAAPIDVQANGDVNLRLLNMFSSDVKTAGSLDLDLRGSGTFQKPTLQGKIQIKDAALSTSSAPVGVSNLNGTLDITNQKLQIRDVKGEMGGGQIALGGSIAFSPAIAFNVALQGKSIRLLYPQGVRTIFETNLAFTGNMQAAQLSGRALIDALNFTPDFDLTTFASQFNGTSLPPSGQSFADNIKLAVAVQSTSNLAARSTALSLEGAANLQVIGTASNPVIVGRVDLTSGELFFMNNRYQLQRGIITFDNPNVTTPVLNVQATTIVEQYNLTLTLTGPLDKLTTNYVSDPGLPTADIISLLYRGQTTEEAAAQGTTTDSFLAGQAASRVSSGIQKLAGISSLQIDPLLGGNNANPSARIALQQRVTKNFLFTFSTDVAQPNQEIVQGDYQFTKRWSMSVTRDELGGVSVLGKYHTKF
jgi:translocation and assembly module TamB